MSDVFKAKNNIYGWNPDLPDHRDFLYSAHLKTLNVEYPEIVDLTSLCSPIEDQGNLGSCVANSLVGSLEFLETKAKHPSINFSRLFLYYNARLLEGNVSYDSGAYIRDGVKALNRWGVCHEGIWPYDISKFTRRPTIRCYKDANNHQILSYFRLMELDDMLHCLADGYPFVFGFSVYESFESNEVATTGIVPMPNPTEKLLGGHAVMAVGYNMTDRRFLVRNSWGVDWGMKGYFTIPFDYLANNNLSDDFWTIRSMEI